MWDTGRSPEPIVEELGLKQISDRDQLATIVARVIVENPEPVTNFKEGKETSIRFLIGQVMRATRGKANPQLAEKMLREQM